MQAFLLKLIESEFREPGAFLLRFGSLLSLEGDLGDFNQIPPAPFGKGGETTLQL